MRYITFLFMYLVILIQHPAYSIDYQKNVLGVLSGKVIYYDTNGIEQPVIGRNIQIIYNRGIYKKTARTNNEGEFIIPIRKDYPLIKGEEIKIKIQDNRFFIISPYNGAMFSPRTISNFKLNIVAITNESIIQTNRLSAKFSTPHRKNRNNTNNITYTVQARSTSSINEANTIKNILIKSGFDAYVRKSRKDNKYKVLVSKFDNRENANRLKNRIRKNLNRKYKDAFVRTVSLLFPLKT